MPDRLDYQLTYRRNLPHIQPPGATLFLTTHLHGSLPVQAMLRLRQEAQLRLEAIDRRVNSAERHDLISSVENRYFGRFDDLLDNASQGPVWLSNPVIARMVGETLHNRDGVTYDLIAFCIMPNHLHIILTPLPDGENGYFSISRIMHVLKGYSARNGNEILGRKGNFWQAESYDHYVRDANELQRIVYYVIANPVKAGLVEDWANWPWTYWKFAPV